MLIVCAEIAAVCAIVVFACRLIVALGAAEALDRMADRMLGPASSDEFQMGVLLSMDSGRVPHEQRHGGGC